MANLISNDFRIDNFFLEANLTVLSNVDGTVCTIVIYYKRRTSIKTIKYISLRQMMGLVSQQTVVHCLIGEVTKQIWKYQARVILPPTIRIL